MTNTNASIAIKEKVTFVHNIVNATLCLSLLALAGIQEENNS